MCRENAAGVFCMVKAGRNFEEIERICIEELGLKLEGSVGFR